MVNVNIRQDWTGTMNIFAKDHSTEGSEHVFRFGDESRATLFSTLFTNVSCPRNTKNKSLH